MGGISDVNGTNVAIVIKSFVIEPHSHLGISCLVDAAAGVAPECWGAIEQHHVDSGGGELARFAKVTAFRFDFSKYATLIFREVEIRLIRSAHRQEIPSGFVTPIDTHPIEKDCPTRFQTRAKSD